MSKQEQVRALAQTLGITQVKAKEVLALVQSDAPANTPAKKELRTYIGKAARKGMRAEVGAVAGKTMAEQSAAVKAKARKWLAAHDYDLSVAGKLGF